MWKSKKERQCEVTEKCFFSSENTWHSIVFFYNLSIIYINIIKNEKQLDWTCSLILTTLYSLDQWNFILDFAYFIKPYRDPVDL